MTIKLTDTNKIHDTWYQDSLQARSIYNKDVGSEISGTFGRSPTFFESLASAPKQSTEKDRFSFFGASGRKVNLLKFLWKLVDEKANVLLAALRSGPSVGQLPVGHLAEAGGPARQLVGGANLLSWEPSGTWGSIFQASKISGLNVFTYHHHLESRFLKQAKTLTNGNDTNDTSRGKTNRVGIQQGNSIFFCQLQRGCCSFQGSYEAVWFYHISTKYSIRW